MSANTAAVEKLMNKSSTYAEAIEDLDKILKEMEEKEERERSEVSKEDSND